MLAVKTPKPKAAPAAEKPKTSAQAPRAPAFNPVWAQLALGIQPKLAVSAPNDPFEREADKVADHHDKPGGGRAGSGGAAGRGKPAPLWDRLVTNLTEATDAMAASRSSPLGSSDALRFSQALGGPLPNVRIHTDGAADKAARSINARAITNGRDVYFAAGEYQPGTAVGDRLLRHELTHVLQSSGQTPGTPRAVSQPSDPAEHGATQAENRVVPPSVHAPSGVLHRQVLEGIEAAIAYGAYKAVRAYSARDETVELQGHPNFDPSDDLANWIGMDDSPVQVHVKFGNMAYGTINMLLDENDKYQSDGAAVLSLSLTGLADEDDTEHPVLLVSVADSVVEGVFGGVPDATASTGDAMSVLNSIIADGTERLMEWKGLEHLKLANETIGELINGHLTLSSVPFDFDLAGAFTGRGNFGLLDGTVTFDASAALHVDGLSDSNLTLSRDEYGTLSGTVQMGVTLSGFEGNLLASFGRGALDIRGTVAVNYKNFEGSVTMMVTNSTSAWAAVHGELAQWPPVGGTESPTLGPAAPAPSAAAPHVVAGWGVVDFRYKDWLHGRAQVIVDPDGEITSLGRVHVPQEITLFEEKEFNQTVFEDISGSMPIADVWDVLVVRIGANGSLKLKALVGPATLRDVHAAGAFSTKPGFPNHLTIGGIFAIHGGAALELSITAYIAAEAQVPIVGHVTEYARVTGPRASLTVTGTAEVDGYADAQAAIHRVQPKGSDEATYSMAGTLSAGGSMFFTLQGHTDVEIPGLVNKRLITIDKKQFVMGHIHGRVSFRNFKIGDSEPPKMNWVPEGGPPTKKLLKAIVLDDLHGEEPAGEPGTWTNIGSGDVVGDEGQDPTPPAIPSDPHFGITIPPAASPPAPQGPPPAPDGGSAPDSGPPPQDAGVNRAAGVPEAPDTSPVVPDAPPPTAAEQPTADVSFDMEGTPHHLTLEPGPPPVLLMASAPGRLELKLQRRRDEVNRRIVGNPMAPQRDRDQRAALDELITEAHAVEAEARRLGFGDRFSREVPGMRPLAQRIHSFAQQFEWHDIAPFLPSEAQITPQPGETVPVEAQQVLGLPYDKFRAHVATIQAAEALPLIREQREYYALELGDIRTYQNARPSGDTAQAVERRRRELLDRVIEMDREIRRLQNVLNPDGRPELPCFAPDTPVWTPQGQRPIGSLRPGDAVLTWDGGRVLQGEVLDVHRKATLQFYAVCAAGAAVHATGRHPFWVEDRRDWVPACELQAGDRARLADGRIVEIGSITPMPAEGASTVDLSITPYPTYFVGPGILVHNTPPVRHYGDKWKPPTKPGPYMIYLGINQLPGEFSNSIYVGQTMQTKSKRQSDHRAEALRWLDDHPSVPDTDPEKRYYRFKKELRLDIIADGLRNVDQADWLEQKNMDYERGLSHELMNRREELKSTAAAVRQRIIDDPAIQAAGLCP
jgi:Domain of unknown function (DUF4157)